jgi:hypothetical protein
MPRIDVRCSSCETISEVFRHHTDHPKTPPCPKCDGATVQVHLPSSARTLPPAVVVFAAPDGTLRFPGDPNGATAAKYEKMGYTRQEYRGWAEVRKLESRVNKQQYTQIVKRVERELQFREQSQHARRSDLYNGIRNGFQIPETVERTVRGQRVLVRTGRMKTVHLSPGAQEIAMAAVERNNEKPGPKAYDSGFHVEAYAYNRSNRDGSRTRD